MKNVVAPDQVAKAISMYWDNNEKLSAVKRDDPNTWVNENWPSTMRGFNTDWGQAHSEAMWYLRTYNNVK